MTRRLDSGDDGGDNGHDGMDTVTRARVGVCPTHGAVTPLIVGNRWKCPFCGVFIRKQKSLVEGASPESDGRSVDEVFWRLEVHRILEAIAANLGALPGHAQALVDHRTAMDWIAWTDAVHMTLPATELENAVQRITELATKLIRTPQLFRDLAVLETECSRRAEARDRLRGEEAVLKGSVRQLEELNKQLRDALQSVEASANMSSEDIVQHIRHFSETQWKTKQLEAANVRLNRECWSAYYYLTGLKQQIQRSTDEVQRFRQLEGAAWETLADKLTTTDLMNLIDLRQKKQLDERWNRVMLGRSPRPGDGV